MNKCNCSNNDIKEIKGHLQVITEQLQKNTIAIAILKEREKDRSSFKSIVSGAIAGCFPALMTYYFTSKK